MGPPIDGMNGSMLLPATYKAGMFNLWHQGSLLDLYMFQIKMFLMEQFELLASSCQNSSERSLGQPWQKQSMWLA